ncbi:MAG: sigma-70 family RNA polymerase sigma factor [Planctomycetes bacterium]|nr:sigma-70 family RNA polymerase sigma factor [Planctomycetota bacterium]MCB9870025.1 sigma-70 family RNA polymerase sigma factor [Planctomycetota bacterium]
MREPKLDPDRPRSTLHHVESARAGDESAWDRLVVKIGEEVDRLVGPRDLPPQHDRDDLLQAVAFGVFRSIDRFEAHHDDSFRAYVRSIVRHRVTDLWRRARAQARRGDALPKFGPDDSELPEFCLDREDDRARRPISLIEAQEIEERLRAVTSQLTPRHQDVLRLREDEGLDYEKIAPLVGLENAATARGLYAYAKNRRAALMRNYFDGTAE